MKKYIVTHAGVSHRDDFLSCALALTLDSGLNRIERRDPTEAELDDPNVWCIDIGLRHEPHLHNFDHHQLSKDAAPACSLTYILQHMGILEASRRYNWVTMSEKLDSKGPFVVAEGLANEVAETISLDDDDYYLPILKVWFADRFTNNMNPIERVVLDMFYSSSVVSFESPLFDMMLLIGRDTTKHLSEGKTKLDLIAKHAIIEQVGDFQVMSLMAHELDEVDIWEEVDITVRESKADIAVIVSPDSRGDGWQLNRLNDDPRVDFTLIKDRDEIVFAHVSGFVATTTAIFTSDKINELILAATVKSTTPRINSGACN